MRIPKNSLRLIGVWSWMLLFGGASVASPQGWDGAAGPRKQATAVRVPNDAIRVDGRLDEGIWRQAVPITDFIQKEPAEGAPPSDLMDVRFVYDDDALYVGARMHSTTAIQAPMGRRDRSEQSEHLLVALDTFLDRRTSYMFGVTAAGVRIDRFYADDDETKFDEGYDPIWQAKTTCDQDGWTAELWIPFSQLRFNSRPELVWGLNIQRYTPTLNEDDYWVPVARTQKAWASHFGDLRGIRDLHASKRIELLPYVSGASTINSNRDGNNPFDDGRNLASVDGADLKMGIGPNLTLQGTVNPDFGQVEADPAEVNLSVQETTFTEKRPFFTEGSRLLNLTSNTVFFYTRRIGAAPSSALASGDYVDIPRSTRIISAAKLTGRLPSGTSLGFLGALTDEAFARSSNRAAPLLIQKTRLLPRTGYAVGRVQQEFGLSWVSLMATGVHRVLAPSDPLAAVLSRNAASVVGEFLLRSKRGDYELQAWGGGARVTGETSAIARLQRSSVHYLQRPDKDYALYDPNRLSLPGYATSATLRRVGGRHWLWTINGNLYSPGFAPNDMGKENAADLRGTRGALQYRETKPGKIFRSYSLQGSQNYQWNFGRNLQSGVLQGDVSLTFKNFWVATLSTARNPRQLNQQLTRGGPLMEKPAGWLTTATLRNPPSSQTGWNVNLSRSTDEDRGTTTNVSGGLSFRPGPRWLLSITPSYLNQLDTQQYVTTLSGGRLATYGQRYVFSFVERHTYSAQMRVGFTLKPDVTVDVYSEPFASSGRYYDFGELSAPRARTRLVYGTAEGTSMTRQPDGTRTVTDGAAAFTLKNYDFNVRSFRSNVVLRWEWRPGSTFYAVWQANRYISEPFGTAVSLGNLFNAVTAPGANYFIVKMSLWVPLK